jgi:phosphotransferase system enzyme I (PtsI)
VTIGCIDERRLKGQAICPGIAAGHPYFLLRADDPIPESVIAPANIEAELQRYRQALQESCKEVEEIKEQLCREEAIEGVAILEAHLAMMNDSMFTTSVESVIEGQLKGAETALADLLRRYEERFSQIDDQFFRERFFDIQDIGRRVMSHLCHYTEPSLQDVPAGSIVFARELAPTDAAQVKGSQVAAFVTESGGVTSHAAIVAKAKGIPFVSDVDIDAAEALNAQHVIVDGRSGELVFNPSAGTQRCYGQILQEMQDCFEEMEHAASLKAETYDGYPVGLSSNVDMVWELDLLHRYGGKGVGLFRSEFLCLSQNSFPSEDEQYEIYRSLVEKVHGRPVVIRAFDLGGDKVSDAAGRQGVDNNSLGCRAIRFLLKEKDIFRTQLRAILRASAHGSVGVMFPMISGLPELREAKAILQECRGALLQQGTAVGQDVRVGCMIEVPSAAIICDILARECDFLSIGTNDLVQYTLAVDRASQAVSGLYGPTHPALVRMIKLVVSEANRHQIPVSVCGEIAADPRFTALLLGLGVRELSVSARYLPVVKHAVRHVSIVEAVKLAERVLQLPTTYEIEALLEEEYARQQQYSGRSSL